jgi:putative ABC transport system permease protein
MTSKEKPVLLRSRLAHRSVPLARRQLLAEPAKLAVALAAVAAAVALVLMLAGLRRGMGEQVTVYVDRQAPVLVGQAGTRNFVSHASVLPEEVGARIAVVRGTASAVPISQQYAMLHLHGRRVVSLLIGSDPGAPGGPWRLASGRAPGGPGELALDRVLASEHGLRVGNTVSYRGASLRIVGLSSGTSGFMTPLVFATRETVNALGRRPATASFFLVSPAAGTSPAALAARIEQAVPGVSALTRDQVAANDRQLFVSSFEGPLLAMVAIAAAVAVLVIGLTVYSSTIERSREYATLAAIGLRRGALLRLAAAQALALSLAGTGIGILLAVAGARGVAALAPKYLIALSAESAALIAAAALAMALLAALVPARHLARLDPASAFRR